MLTVTRQIWLVALAAALTVGLTTTPAASAHPGGIWASTAANTALSIKEKFPRIEYARCYPPTRYGHTFANSQIRGTVREWDHFVCILAPRNASICFVVAHWTGGEWHNFVLTSYRYHGCTPYVLRVQS